MTTRKRKEFWIQRHIGRVPCEDGGRVGSNATTSQGMPRIAGVHANTD